MSPSEAEEQAEKRRVMLQNADVRQQQQGTTFFQHALVTADETSQGRFAAMGKPSLIGQSPTPATAYPAASPASQVELPPEPPLGFENPALESPTGLPSPVDSPALDDAPTVFPSVEQHSGAGPSSSDPAGVHLASPPDTFTTNVDAGSPPSQGSDNGQS
jgi:hypothetical protein